MPRVARPSRASGSSKSRQIRPQDGCGTTCLLNLNLGGLKLPEWCSQRVVATTPPSQPPLRPSLSAPGHADKAGPSDRLMSLQAHDKFTGDEEHQMFQDLDRDGDGRLTPMDLRAALRARNLPETYALAFMQKAKGGGRWTNTISWEQFQRVLNEREGSVLRAFAQLEVSAAGRLAVPSIRDALRRVELPDTEANAWAMLRAMGSAGDGFVCYSRFSNFMMLLPSEELAGDHGVGAWFDAATVVPKRQLESEGAVMMGTGKMVLTAALAGGLAAGTSTLAVHPIDTLKTKLQSIAGATVRDVPRWVSELKGPGLYRGVLPAVGGSALSHGVRTGAYEGALRLLMSVSGGAWELQAQGLAAATGTLVGTVFRVPCELLKQRLQMGQHPNVVVAAQSTLAQEGWRGLFRGTLATLSREVPFYAFGMVAYEQLKKAANGSMWGGEPRLLSREEIIAVGAAAGALGSLLTTPADVMKTRIMTAPPGATATAILVNILQKEGVGALFKGALPRILWIAPVGAMNFAGYELAKNALTSSSGGSTDSSSSSSGGGIIPPGADMKGSGKRSDLP